MSRAHITKAAQYYKTKQESAVAQQSANKFTAKQSQFARKEEERQARDAQESSGSVISKFEAARRGDGGNRMSGAAPSTLSGNKLMTGTGNKRLQKYQLDEDRRRPRDETETFGSLMGHAAPSAAPQASGGTGDEGGDSEAPRKKSRLEKFQEVVANSKHHRHEQQKERAARDKETDMLDEEFNDVMHLLNKRDRRQEERDAFLASGNAEVRDMLKAFKANRTAKVLKLDNMGSAIPSASREEDGGEAARALDAADKALLASLIKTDPKTMAHGRNVNTGEGDEAPAAPQPKLTEDEDEDDDFDALMGAMRMETKKAHAVERTLTEEEELEHLQRMQQLQADRGEVPTVSAESEQWTRKEWVQKGGDAVFQMGDDAEGDGDNVAFDDEEEEYDDEEAMDEEDGDGAGADAGSSSYANPIAGSSLSNPVDRALANLESFSSRAALMSVDERSSAFQALISELHAHSRRHTLYASQSFRLLLMDAQRRLTNGQPLTHFAMLVLYAVPYVFPVTDYRHEVVTPYLILLCSAISQLPLKTLRNVKDAIVLCSLLQSAMSAGGKYCAEMLVGPLNILALQIEKRALEPHAHQQMRMPCPLLSRCDEALLAPSATDVSVKFTDAITAPIQLLSEAVESREQLLFAAYKLLAGVATSLSGNAAFPCAVGGPVKRLFALLEGRVSPALLATHNATAAVIDEMCTKAEKKRTPLAMRSFRPRPIRLFEPLLVENVDPEVKEHRELKKEIREDRKRVVRHVQAEAVVERRAREKEANAESSRREEKYNQLIGELQAQQHIMKSVDMSMSKARSNKKKSISGAPKTSEEGGGGGKDE